MPSLERCCFARGFELAQRIVADGLQQAITGNRGGRIDQHHRLLDELLEQVQYVCLVDTRT